MKVEPKKFIIQILPFVIMGLFATKLGQAYRLADGTVFAYKLINIGGFIACVQERYAELSLV